MKCIADFSFTSEMLVRSFIDRIEGNPDASGLLAVTESKNGGPSVIVTIVEGHQHYIENIANAYGGCRTSNWASK